MEAPAGYRHSGELRSKAESESVNIWQGSAESDNNCIRRTGKYFFSVGAIGTILYCSKNNQ